MRFATRAEYEASDLYRTRKQRSWNALQRDRATKYGVPFEDGVDRAALIAEANCRCYLCNGVYSPDYLDIDHVIPLSRGGGHVRSNLAVACQSCNEIKRMRLPSELEGFASPLHHGRRGRPPKHRPAPAPDNEDTPCNRMEDDA